MKTPWTLAGMLLAGVLIGAGYAPREEAAQGRSDWARADTDSVGRKTAVITGDSLSGYTGSGGAVQVFTGNVTGIQDSTELFADWGKRYADADSLTLVSNVVVIHKRDTLRADTVHYRESIKVGRAVGNVRMSDGAVTARAPAGTFFIDEERAAFFDGVTLVDSAATVTGNEGMYWSGEERAHLRGAVRYTRDDDWLESDSLSYLRAEEVLKAWGHIAMQQIDREEDVEVRTQLFCDRVRTQEEGGVRESWGRPLMLRFRQDSTGVDTLVLQADVIKTEETDSLHRLEATGRVRYWAPDLAFVADTMVAVEREAAAAHAGATHDESGEIRLFGMPMLWTEGAQVSGDSMRVIMTGRDVDSLKVWGEAFVAHEDTVLQRINQMRGQTLVAWFGAENRRTFVVGPNAEIVFFRRDEDEAPDGAVQISGDEAVLVLVDDEPEQVRFGESQGTYFPEGVLEMPLQLQGYRWEPEGRPVLEQFLADQRYVKWMRRKADS